MGRRRKKEPRRNQFCLRLTDKQLELLQRYQDVREQDSEVDALRLMIDGLESWLVRRSATQTADGLHQSEAAHSGLSSAPTDVGPGASIAPRAEEEPSPAPDDDDDGTSVGDFGGHPRLKLPGMPDDDEIA